MSLKVLSGLIVSDVNDKTIVVSVVRRFKHKLYKKIVRRSKKYHVHYPDNSFSKGQYVSFQEHKPLSKKKRWIVLGKA